MVHEFQDRVFFPDTDAGGVIYHGRYLNFFQRARDTLLLDQGVDFKAMADSGLYFAVSHADLRFKAPAHLGDVVIITTELTDIKKVTFKFSQVMYDAGKSTRLCEADLRVGFINAELKPTPMPADLVATLKRLA